MNSQDTSKTADRPTSAAPERTDFIREIIENDLRTGKHKSVVTRFPPEPNGYLHIGHAKSINLNFGLARQYGGRCHLRFDDTNPETEEVEYAESIKRDVRWLGGDWGEHLYYASDYFDRMYAYAVELIEKGLAYVDSSTEEEIRARRGTVNEPGQPSPFRDRSVEENLDLFARMKAGEFPDGSHVLRAKIDMSAANMKMRDPLLYRIRNVPHYRTGDKWHIYPMYDFAHCLEDSIEGVTHSICTLEFENNREIYDWLLDNLDVPRPQPRQYEFARLNLTYTVMSKRKLLQLVKEKHVAGWDDPRMPTIAGLRRRGYTPEAIRRFCDDIGVAKTQSTVEFERLEFAIRDDLNTRAPRVMAVLRPLKVVVENWPADRTEWIEAGYWPKEIPKSGTRKVPFTRELYIERDDFMETPTEGFLRLAPGREVRLRYGYLIKCERVVKNDAGEIVELRCTHDPATAGGSAPDGRKVRSTIHWVSAEHSLPAEVRLYDRLFSDERPDSHEGVDFLSLLNPASLEVIRDARIEPSLKEAAGGEHFQFERQGYFFTDPIDSRPGAPVFNRVVTLRDTWAKARAEETPKAATAKRREEKPAAPAAAPRQVELNATGRRFRDELGLGDEEARVLSETPALQAFFEEALLTHGDAKSVAKWIVNELLRALKGRQVGELPFGAPQFAELVKLVDSGTVTGRAGKDVFEEMLRTGEAPAAIVEKHGLKQVSDAGALEATVDEVVAAHPDEATRYREGKTALLGFFVGQVMKKTRGKANPQVVTELVRKRLA